jgi:hypothetical protein
MIKDLPKLQRYNFNRFFNQLGYCKLTFIMITPILKISKNKILYNIFVQLGFSSLADSSWSNDWQKVQYNTDLLKQRHKYLYRMFGAKLKVEIVNEMK